MFTAMIGSDDWPFDKVLSWNMGQSGLLFAAENSNHRLQQTRLKALLAPIDVNYIVPLKTSLVVLLKVPRTFNIPPR